MLGRYLGRAGGTETPGSLVFIDTNSRSAIDPSNSDRRFASLRTFAATKVRMEKDFVTRRLEHSGQAASELWEWLAVNSDTKRCTWVFGQNLYAHLTKLDFWRLLDEKEFTLDPILAKRKTPDGKQAYSWFGKMCLEDRPFFVVCRSGSKTYKFVDTCNYWPDGLWGSTADTESVSNPSPKQDAEPSEWIAHATARVKILEDNVVRLLQQWRYEQCGTFQLTAPMLAMSHFRHTCSVRTPDNDKVDIVCLQGHVSHEMERRSYHSGRVQAFYVGEAHERVYHIDCNSLYPYVMRKQCFPRRYVRYQLNPSVKELTAISHCYGAVAHVLVHSSSQDFPVKCDDVTYHADGRFWATLAGPELARAISTDSVIACSAVQIYSIAPIFRRWIDYWYDRKIAKIVYGTGEQGDYDFAKMIMNSLSGKFAQRGRKWKDIPGKFPLENWSAWPELNLTDGTYEKWRGVGGNAQRLTDESDPRHSFPLISSYISAYGREYMRSVIADCGRDNVLYMATDSLILTESGFNRLEKLGYIHPYELGLFKVKGSHSYALITGPNQYQLDEKVTSSGLRGASIAQGGKGESVELVERIGTIIRRPQAHDISIERVKVPPIKSDIRGRLTMSGRWEPFRLVDPIVDLSDLVGLNAHRVYSLGSRADRIVLLCDV